jgi:hypothetical protein
VRQIAGFAKSVRTVTGNVRRANLFKGHASASFV